MINDLAIRITDSFIPVMWPKDPKTCLPDFSIKESFQPNIWPNPIDPLYYKYLPTNYVLILWKCCKTIEYFNGYEETVKVPIKFIPGKSFEYFPLYYLKIESYDNIEPKKILDHNNSVIDTCITSSLLIEHINMIEVQWKENKISDEETKEKIINILKSHVYLLDNTDSKEITYFYDNIEDYWESVITLFKIIKKNIKTQFSFLFEDCKDYNEVINTLIKNSEFHYNYIIEPINKLKIFESYISKFTCIKKFVNDVITIREARDELKIYDHEAVEQICLSLQKVKHDIEELNLSQHLNEIKKIYCYTFLEEEFWINLKKYFYDLKINTCGQFDLLLIDNKKYTRVFSDILFYIESKTKNRILDQETNWHYLEK